MHITQFFTFAVLYACVYLRLKVKAVFYAEFLFFRPQMEKWSEICSFRYAQL